MENASKALLIAGAILVTIIIISLGIIVITNQRDTINNANVNKQAAEAFNNEYEAYVGSSVTANQARTLMSAAFATKGGDHVVTVKYVATKNGTPAAVTSMPALDNAKKYTTTVEYGNDGYVNAVTAKPTT